jgi:hypothetical protein
MGNDTPVGSVVPMGFDAYARVCHPAFTRHDDRRPVRWSEVAAWAGRVVHAEMQWEAISRPALAKVEPLPWHDEPYLARCPPEVRGPLTDILRVHTTSPDPCWVCIWDGYGGLEDVLTGIPRVHHPQRDYALLRASLETIASGVLVGPGWAEPNIWWPEDRAWCVATEIDFRWTYVAGTHECIRAVLADSRLEALATQPDHLGSYNGDVINGPVAPR